MSLVAIVLVAIIFIAIASYVFWHIAKYSWLDKICGALVFSLPFERIPSLDIGGANLRISQVVTLFGLWVVLILFLKKDSDILKQKFSNVGIYFIIFIILSLPSWVLVINSTRFWVTSIATWLCFGAAFLLANFSRNIFQKLRLALVGIGISCLFGVYQFFGDLAGLPIILTGLREQYTKIVFGIPRIHSTALEPLYFAGMLFLPIFFSIFVTLSKKRIFTKIPGILNFIILLFFLTIFSLTLSKSAYLALGISLFFAIIFSLKKFPLWSILKSFSGPIAIGFTGLTLLVIYSQKAAFLVQDLINNFNDTLNFQFASSVERLDFIKTAFILLPQNIVFGIGSGQFGVWASYLLNSYGTEQGSYLIVNNVYLEVWLEFGLLPFLLFIFILLSPIWINFKILLKSDSWVRENNLSRLILIFSLFAYYIQWLTFSPVFIMPIFILLGLLVKLESED